MLIADLDSLSLPSCLKNPLATVVRREWNCQLYARLPRLFILFGIHGLSNNNRFREPVSVCFRFPYGFSLHYS